MVRVAGMDEDLLVFFVPMIHRSPIKGQVVSQRRCVLQRLRVTPHGVIRNAVTDLNRPVRGVALERAVRRVIALLQEVHAHVFFGEIVNGQEPLLVHQLDAPAVSHGLAIEHHPNPPRGVLEVQHVVPRGFNLKIERLFALITERSGPDRKGHRSPLSIYHRLKIQLWELRLLCLYTHSALYSCRVSSSSCGTKIFHTAVTLRIAGYAEPTSGLEPLTPAHYECAVSGC